MKTKTFYDCAGYPGLDQYESTLMTMNGIPADKIDEMLPDIKYGTISPSLYFEKMERIDKGNEFSEFIKKNLDKIFFVIGDYDCDGILATTIMSMGLTLCGAKTIFTAPDRFVDGYGMKTSHIDEAIKQGASVIITVDNGITALDEIAYAKSKGLSVIVTDHHIPQGKNEADLVIDPWLDNDSFKDISGATVAFKLIYELQKVFGFDQKYLNDFMALAGITCCSDVMPLLKENRFLLKATMQYMNKEAYVQGSLTKRLCDMLDFYVPGTASTVDLGLDGTYRDFNKENIDFYFVPMINAANRVLGNVNSLIYDIMTLFSHDYAGYPHVYRDLNKERKFMRTEMLRLHKKNDSTQAIVEALYPNPSDGNFMGISGLVASDIVESEGKPTLIGIEHENGIVHFSGRSVPGFDLYSALDEIKKSHPEIDFKFGGHAEALGMSCNKNVIPTMQTLLSEEFTKSGKHEEAEIYYDLGGSLQNVKELFMRYYPFGSGFEFPRFYIEGLVGFCNFSKRTFTMPDISRNEEITVFSKADYDKVVTIATKKRSELIKMEFSLSCDDRGEIYLKADKFF